MYEMCRDCWQKNNTRYKDLEQRRLTDIHNLVYVLKLTFPETYRKILDDLGMQEYVEIYALQTLINGEKHNE